MKAKAQVVETTEFKVHPAADLFPMMPEEELADLAKSIKANGQRFPIIVDGDLLIDGRNRLAACKLAGIEPIFEELDGRDPIALIADVNLSRRNLTKGQHAMGYAFLYPEGVKGKKDVLKRDNFSKQRLSAARSVLRFSPELAKTVFAGVVPLDQALKTIDEQELQAEGNATKLERITLEAPDLLDLVRDERISLNSAFAEMVEREKKRRDAYESGVRSARRLPGDIIGSVLEIIGGRQARLEKEAPIVMPQEEMNQANEMWSRLVKGESLSHEKT